ncbi:MAG: SGNH/GDSL hydrolase family protein [Gordonia sp. (in: high G+C Gram-positive bacteria)]
MGNVVKRIWSSAPIWAWVVMGVCVIVLVAGLVFSGHRSSGAAPDTATAGAAETSAAAPPTPATVAFIDGAKANPTTPKTIVLLGDSTGSDPQGWAPALGKAISASLGRPVATKFWNSASNQYGPIVGLGDGKNGAIGFWNGSANGKDAAYAQKNLGLLIGPDVTPDLILLNFGHTEDPVKPLAPQIQPLIDDLRKKYPKAQIAVIKQNPAQHAPIEASGQLTGYASAMDAESIQVIDVYSAFPSDEDALAKVLANPIDPNAAGQKLWTKTVLTAFGLPTQQ